MPCSKCGQQGHNARTCGRDEAAKDAQAPRPLAAKSARRGKVSSAHACPDLPDVLWQKIIRNLFHFGRRPVVTAAVSSRLRSLTEGVAGENIPCDPSQAALERVLTNPRGGSIMCAVEDAVHLSEAKVKAYSHHKSTRYPKGYYLVFPEAEIRKMIADHGGYDAVEARRLKKLKRRKARVDNAKERFTERTDELDAALADLGLERREDSSLCDDFVRGATKLSAAEVAQVMAKMRYYYEHCAGFQADLAEAEADVDAEVERIAADNRSQGYPGCREFDSGGYYCGIRADAAHEVLGTANWREYKETLMHRYPLPEQWPWL